MNFQKTLPTLILGFYLTVSAVAGEFSTYHIGNSLTGDLMSKFYKIVTPYENSLGNTYRYGVHLRPHTSITYIYANPDCPQSQSLKGTNLNYQWSNFGDPAFVSWKTVLPANHWDVVTLQPWQDDSRATLKADTMAINALIATTRTRPDNAATRFYIYAPWADVKYGDLDSYRAAFVTPTSNSPEQPGVATRDYFRHVTDSVRKTNPSVAMIPAGEVLLALDDKMRAGKFEHFTSVRQLHRDVIHLNSVGQNVVAWTGYATIFKKSPVGLANDVQTGPDDLPFKNETEISPADLKLMQETVWEVVHSPELRGYTGVQ